MMAYRPVLDGTPSS